MKVSRRQTGEKILFRAIKLSSVVRSLIVFGKAFKENSVEILSMNRNINILGMYYVNLYFNGVLDKINGSKGQALKAVGEILVVCAVPLEGSVQHSAHGDVEVLQPPPAPGPLEGLLQHHQLHFVNLWYNLAQATVLQHYP